MNDVSFEIKKGEIVSIIGANGSGKSTVLRLLTKLIHPNGGCVYLEGKKIDEMSQKAVAQKLTMLPQVHDHHIDLTVYDLIKHGRNPYLKWYESANTEDKDIIDFAIEATNLEHLKYRPLHSLSGGERQRAWIAMSLAQTPNILLLDEPTTYLDISHQLEVMELVKRLNEENGITIVMVLHDLNQAAKYSHRLIAMKSGSIVREGSPKEIFCCAFFEEVFGIDVSIFHDEETPFFYPKVLGTKT
ncbi:MAG: ABC transporter ATP-binding protein [Bacillus sp. (in: Bacteria)]|nr:ABC transporter ATP-binding protein [Bacillus sp. (in: firmicutes)]